MWQKAVTLTRACYEVTDTFPSEHRFVLASQIRRAATSIAANIAEGHNRRGRKVYSNHVNIALGSVAELESHVEIAIRVGAAERERLQRVLQLASELNRMLHALAKALAAPPRT